MTGKSKPKILFGCLVLCLALGWAVTAPGQQGRGMALPADALPEDLRQLDVKDYYIPSDFREVGVIHALSGRVVVVHRADRRAFFGTPGDTIHENDELYTLADSRCRILFLSDDVVNMGPETRLAVDTFQDLRSDGEKTSIFTMARGKAMFYAMRLFRYKDTRFQVKTPTAIVGVRGTKFGIDVFQVDPDRTAALTPVRVADSGRGFDALLAQAGTQGQAGGTIIACGDGILDVYDPETGQLLAEVNPNEDFNTQTGQKTFDPANRTLNQIQQASRVLDDDEDDGLPEPDDPFVDEDDADLSDDTALQDGGDLAGTLTDVTQAETGSGTESQDLAPDSITPFRGTEANPLMGYFSALLFYRSNGDIRNAFVSSYPQQMDPLDEAYAYGVITPPSDYITADEGPTGDDVGEVTLDGVPSGEFSIEGPTKYLGQYSYLQWGYHQAAATPTPVVDGTNYELVNKFWFVEGYPTTDFAGLSGFYNYSGVVHGTYYAPGVTADLKGSYTSQVHFGSSYIQNFQMSASGGGHNISFTQSGQATVDINNNGRFNITGGAFTINGKTVDYWGVNGAHFGGGAKEQGGAYAAACPATNEGSYGIFAGKR